jgi:hypothetical protein
MFGPLMSGRVRLFAEGDLDGAKFWISEQVPATD